MVMVLGNGIYCVIVVIKEIKTRINIEKDSFVVINSQKEVNKVEMY